MRAELVSQTGFRSHAFRGISPIIRYHELSQTMTLTFASHIEFAEEMTRGSTVVVDAAFARTCSPQFNTA